MDNSIKKGKAALLITDSYKASVNGIAMFSQFFVADVLMPTYEAVTVLEVSNMSVHTVVDKEVGVVFDHVYVNANFSASDSLMRSANALHTLHSIGINLSDGFVKTMISHGWAKIRFRFNWYGFYYRLKFQLKGADLQRLFFYDRMLFISRQSDAYRHADYQFCVNHHIPIDYYDFPARYVQSMHANAATVQQSFILVIANFEPVKNLWWLVRYNLYRTYIQRKPAKSFVLLIKPRLSVYYKLFTQIAAVAGVLIVTDQSQKNALLSVCRYLFIPSHTEYTPLVAFEAFGYHKSVISLYSITGLSDFKPYRYLKL